MVSVLVATLNYLKYQQKIMDDIIEFALKTEEDAEPLLKFFRREEKDLQKRIMNGPLNAGIDFPRPVKKAVSTSGKYIILYTYIPLDSATNSEVTRVNLDSIMLAASGKYNNKVIMQLPSYDIE
jgi:hypothetical protein